MKNNKEKLQDFAERLCDKYCKYPDLTSDQDALDEICMKCPLNQIFELFSEDK